MSINLSPASPGLSPNDTPSESTEKFPIRREAKLNLSDGIEVENLKCKSIIELGKPEGDEDFKNLGLTDEEIEEIESKPVPNVVSHIHPTQVRWFYKLKKNCWIPFIGADSLKLELRYRKIAQHREMHFQKSLSSLQYFIHQTKTLSNEVQKAAKEWAKSSFNFASRPWRNYFNFQRAPVVNENVELHPNSEARIVHPSSAEVENESVYDSENGDSIEEVPVGKNVVDLQHLDPYEVKLPSFRPHRGFADLYVHRPGPSAENITIHGNSDSPTINSFPLTSPDPECTSDYLPSPNCFFTPTNQSPGSDTPPRWTSSKPRKIINPIVYVHAGTHEVNLKDMSIVSSFWEESPGLVRRGVWFDSSTWEPIEHEYSEQIEKHHLEKYMGHFLNESSDPIPEDQKVSMVDSESGNFGIISYSQLETYLVRYPIFLEYFNMSKSNVATVGKRIQRGYKELAEINDKPKPIDHIVFVIHGIGQQNIPGRIAENTANMRKNMKFIKTKYFKQLRCRNFKLELFPIEWRNTADLETIQNIIWAITPDHVKVIRTMLNQTAMDVMYYISPIYRQIIQNALRDEVNRIYLGFIKRDPGFKKRGGKVSIIAHSLGAVISFDVAAGQNPKDIPFTLDKLVSVPAQSQFKYLASGPGASINLEDEHKSKTRKGILPKDYYKIELPDTNTFVFEIEFFITLGSPLAVFLALRWENPEFVLKPNFILPQDICKRFYNIFHDSDPVGYRIEPLINRHYTAIRPVPIEKCHRKEKVASYDELPHCEGNHQEHNVTYISQLYSISRIWGTSIIPSFRVPSPVIVSSVNPFASRPKPAEHGRQETWVGSDNLNTSHPWPLQPSSDIEEDEFFFIFPPPKERSEFINDLSSSTPLETLPESEDIPETLLHNVNIPDRLPYRMDYILPRYLPFWVSHLYSIAAHSNYWDSLDTHYFILKQIYQLEDHPTAFEPETVQEYMNDTIMNVVYGTFGE